MLHWCPAVARRGEASPRLHVKMGPVFIHHSNPLHMCSRADLDFGLQAFSGSILEQSSTFQTRLALCVSITWGWGSACLSSASRAAQGSHLTTGQRILLSIQKCTTSAHLSLHALSWQSRDWHSYFGVKLLERLMANRVRNLTPPGLWLGIPYLASNMALRHPLQLLLAPVPRTRHLV